MDSLGDILYIIVMLAAVVISFYKKAKGSGEGGTFSPEQEAGDPFDEVFPTGDKWFEEEQPQKQPPKPVLKKEEIIPRPRTLRINYQKIQKKPERTSRLTSRIAQNRGNLEEPEREARSFWDEEPLDLQTAVIYAEVIKRPDY